MRLVDPCPSRWRSLFQQHADQLASALPSADIEHIGSTAIATIAAKDVVDIIVGVDVEAFASAVETTKRLGYRLDGRRDLHAWLCWPRVDDRRVIIHLVPAGGDEWVRRIRFRDVLRADRTLAAEYEAIKQRAADATDDWTEYTGMKRDFVQRVLTRTGMDR